MSEISKCSEYFDRTFDIHSSLWYNSNVSSSMKDNREPVSGLEESPGSIGQRAG